MTNFYKRIYNILLFVTIGASFAFGRSDVLDSDGYPVMYVRGQFNSWGWDDAHRFVRQGNVYSITIDQLDGEFKVSGTDWQYNLGSADNNVVVCKSAVIDAVQDGHNIKAESLSDVTISFAFEKAQDKGMAPTDLSVVCKGAGEGLLGTSGSLPVLFINVYMTDSDGNRVVDSQGNGVFDNEIIDYNLSHKNYFHAEYWLDINQCQWMIDDGAESVGSREAPLPLDIKARGNWTRRGFSKKPFKLKLGKAQNLLGLTPESSKHYALMAHADDSYGYLRTFISFNIAKRIQLPWTPSQQPIEVVINNDYRGIYFLTESIRIGDGRIDIATLDDLCADSELVSGGYLVELDNYDEDNQIRLDEKSCVSGHIIDKLRVTWDTPEDYSDLQKRFVTEQFEAMNDNIGKNDDGTWAYIDLDDAARYYLVREIMSDVESFHGSTYMFRDRGEGEKWHFSPVWDCGQAFNGQTDNFFYNNDPYGNTWIPSMRANRKFNLKVEETWKWFMAECFDGIIDDVDVFVDRIKDGARADRKRWKDVAPPAGGASIADNSDMDSRKKDALSRLQGKIQWLVSAFGEIPVSCPEPERDVTPAAPLPSYAQSAGIQDVWSGEVDGFSGAEFFNLQGMKIDHPRSGEVVILRKGDKTCKIRVP